MGNGTFIQEMLVLFTIKKLVNGPINYKIKYQNIDCHERHSMSKADKFKPKFTY